MEPADLLDQLARLDGFWDRIERWITPGRALRYLKAVADTAAPSGTSSITRGPVIAQLLAGDGLNLDVSLDYAGTGTVLARSGSGALPVWLVAHLDQFSYLLEPAGSNGSYPLIPFCYHLATEGERPAAAWQFQPGQGMVRVAGGRLVNPGPRFIPESGSPELRSGTRVVLEHPLEWNPSTDRLTGHLDNAVGAVAALLATGALAPLGIPVMAILPDEEEGPEGLGNQTFSRGSRRTVPLLPEPRLAIVLDTHEVLPGAPHPGDGAAFAEKASRTRGAVTPPQLVALQHLLTETLNQRSIPLVENRGYIARSDCVSVLQRTGRVALLGMPVADRHFDAKPPSGSLKDLVALARSIAAYAAVAQSDIWTRWGL